MCESSASSPRHEPIDAASNSNRGDATHSKINNQIAQIGFVFGTLLFPLCLSGYIPILGLVISCIGLHTFDPLTEKNRWRARAAVVLNFLATVLFFVYYIRITSRGRMYE